jgi:hypothetical protein
MLSMRSNYAQRVNINLLKRLPHNRVSGGISPPLPTPPDMRVRIRRFIEGCFETSCETKLFFVTQQGRRSSARHDHDYPCSGVNVKL